MACSSSEESSSSGESDSDSRLSTAAAAVESTPLNASSSSTARSRATGIGALRPSSFKGLNDEDRAKLVSDAVFYVLTQEGRRAPLKKSALFQAVHLSGQPRPFQEEVWRGAQAQLLAVFGLALVEHERKKGTFFVVNKVGEDPGQLAAGGHLRFSDRETAQLGLLHVVLGLIFMSNDVLRDDVLFQFLRKLGLSDRQTGGAELEASQGRRSLPPHLSSDSSVHPDWFGSIRDLVFKEWAQRQHYLEVKKLDDSPDPEQPNYEIRWGPRAEVEIKKSAMLTVIANLYGCSATNFRLQYNKVVKLEGEGAFQTQA